jgi:adenosylcobinamide-GDP ribazoletransferase
VAFLTRLPVGRAAALDGSDVARGAPFFPLVGAGIGAVVGGAAAGLTHILPALVAAAIALAIGAALTGALHLDGLADTADALTAPSRERALAIMRDHATGAYGTTALVLDLIAKTTALAALAAHHDVVAFAVVAGALSRAAPVALAATLASVRGEGVGASFAGHVARARAVAAVVVAAAIAVAVGGIHGAELVGIAAALVLLLGLCFKRWLGGVTGDLLGAASELTEVTALVAAVALIGAQ